MAQLVISNNQTMTQHPNYETFVVDLCGQEGLVVRGFDRYAVDRFGNVYSLYFVSRTKRLCMRSKPKKLSIAVDSYGYGVVTLYSDCEKRTCKVHRLVADAFLNADDSRNQVNHKNGEKLDNRLENLEWCTASENQIHSYHTLYTKPNRPWIGKNNPTLSVAVNVRDCHSGAMHQFPSIKAFCSAKGISKSTVLKRIDTGIPAKGMLISKAYHADVWAEAYALTIE